MFFVKQKTAYAMLIVDCSSYVVSSHLSVAKFRKGVHAAGRWLLAHRAVTEDGPGGNAAAGQRIQSLPVDHQVAVVLDDVGRLEITDIAGVIHRVDQEDRKSTRLNSSH